MRVNISILLVFTYIISGNKFAFDMNNLITMNDRESASTFVSQTYVWLLFIGYTVLRTNPVAVTVLASTNFDTLFHG